MSDDRSDITGISSLDPNVAMKAKQIQKMPPQQAIQFLLSNGVDSRMASMVMKNMMLKKSASSQAPQQKPGQPPPTTVAQDIDNHINQVAQQHASGSSQGLGGLPVSDNLFKGDAEGMAGGGIVHFDDGGYAGGPPLGAPGETSPLDTGAMQQYVISQNMANQQAQAQAQQAAQAQQQYSQAGINMAHGGRVKHFDGGGLASFSPQDIQAAQMMAQSQAQSDNSVQGVPWGPQTPPPDPQTGLQAWLGQQQANPNAVQGVAPPAVRAAQAMQGTAQGQNPLQDQSPYPMGPQAGAQPPRSPTGPPQSPQQSPQGPAQGQGGINMRASGAGGGPGMGGLNDISQVQKDAMAQASPNAPQNTFDAILQRNTKAAQEQGIGAASQSYLQDLEGQKAQIATLASQGKWQALAQAGFAMASAATNNPHGGFLGALAVGGATGAKEYGQALAQYHTQMADVEKQGYLVQQSQEAMKWDLNKTSQKEYQDNVDRYDKLVTSMTDSQYKALSVLVGKEQVAAMRESAQAMRETPQMQAWNAIQNAKTPEAREQAIQNWKDFGGNSAQVQSTNARVAGSEANAEARVQMQRDKLNTDISKDFTVRSTYQKALKGDPVSIQMINTSYPGVLGAGAAPAAGGLPPGWSVTPR